MPITPPPPSPPNVFHHWYRLGGRRGAGVPGYGVPGCGKRGLWWKTRGLSGKHGGKRIFLTKMRSLNFVIVNCNENQFRFSAWNTFFDQNLSKLNKSYYTWLVSCTARQNMLLSKFAKIIFSVTWIKYFTSKLVGFLEGAGKKNIIVWFWGQFKLSKSPFC